MSRRTDEEILFGGVPDDGSAIANKSLREHLNWDEDRYWRVRQRLIDKDALIPGRGPGGSVRRVGVEERALLAEVPADGSTISNPKLNAALGWSGTRYEQVRDRLVEQELLVRGPGPGGTVRLVKKRASTESRKERGDRGANGRAQRPEPEADERVLLAKVPEEGGTISNPKLIEELGWRWTRYERVRDRLVERGQLVRGPGQGGTVRRADDPPPSAAPTVKGAVVKGAVVKGAVDDTRRGGSPPRDDAQNEGSWAERDERTLLAELPRDGTTISNPKLLASLQWRKRRYERVRDRLVDRGLLVRGPGPGGTVRLNDSPDVAKAPQDERNGPRDARSSSSSREPAKQVEERPVRLFIAYSHKDEALRQELNTHLRVLERNGHIESWYDRKIGAGEEWRSSIDRRLQDADIILLLISPEFLASDYCHDEEMTAALRRHDAGEVIVIPVILRHCFWSGAGFERLQALPKDALPVIAWPHRDEAFTDITRGVLAAARRVRERNANGRSAPPRTALLRSGRSGGRS